MTLVPVNCGAYSNVFLWRDQRKMLDTFVFERLGGAGWNQPPSRGDQTEVRPVNFHFAGMKWKFEPRTSINRELLLIEVAPSSHTSGVRESGTMTNQRCR